MTSEGLGEVFKGDSADTCAGKFPLTLMGAERRVSRAQTREGPRIFLRVGILIFLLVRSPCKISEPYDNF